MRLRILLGLALIIGLAVFPIQRKSLAAAPSIAPWTSAGQTFVLDGLHLSVHAHILPASPFVTSGPGDASQLATSAGFHPYHEFSVLTIPFGTVAGVEDLPAARHGGAASYLRLLRQYRIHQGAKVQAGPIAVLFGRETRSMRSSVMLSVDGRTSQLVDIVEWVSEAGGRLWIVRASVVDSALSGATGFAGGVVLSRVGAWHHTTIGMQPDSSGGPQATPSQTGTGITLPVPQWWNGDCDLTTYQNAPTNPKHIASYRLGAVFLGMPACGPRPIADNGPDVTVHFFPKAYPVLEWECVELSMRFMYLAYRVNPYKANGSQVVANYKGPLLQTITNGTSGKAPAPGDVLSYGPLNTSGHTSVVMSSSVDSSGKGTIRVIEENWSKSGSQSFQVVNWTVQASPSVSAWLHNPNNPTTPTPTLTPTATPTGMPTGGGQMIDLGTLPGDLQSQATAINDSGQIVGRSFEGGLTHAFLYSNGQMTDLGTLPGGTYSVANGINASGQIVGSSNTPNSGGHAFLYSNGQMNDLGTLPGGFSSSGTGINDSGQIVGYSDYANSRGYNHAFVYSNGQMTDLGTLPGGNESEAYGINDSDQIVGYAAVAYPNGHAFLYSNGQMSDLGTLPGDTSSSATGINVSGQVVGYSDIPSGGFLHAFLYGNGQMTDLGMLPGDAFSQAYGINDLGQVVGWSCSSLYCHAFLYNPG